MQPLLLTSFPGLIILPSYPSQQLHSIDTGKFLNEETLTERVNSLLH